MSWLGQSAHSARRAMFFVVGDVIPFLTDRRGEGIYLFQLKRRSRCISGVWLCVASPRSMRPPSMLDGRRPCSMRFSLCLFARRA